MATIHFVDKNNNIGQVYSFDKQIGPFCIASCDQNGTKHYIPTDGAGYSSYEEYEDDGMLFKYYYSPSTPSLHTVTAGGEILNAFNKVSVTSWGIPEGTYSPLIFEGLIRQFISINGSRYCLNAFTAKVNGITYNVPRGQPIKYRTTNTAGSGTKSTLRIVTFNDRTYADAGDAGQNFVGTYVVYASNLSGSAQFGAYANYSITIGTGIRFN